MALKIGLTGGIGAGKSLVASLFEMCDVPIYFADDRAKRLMVQNAELKRDITRILGREAYQSDGSLNRRFIAARIFGDHFILSKLNSLVHPRVSADYQQWHDRHQDYPYTLEEAALLFEGGGYLQMDAVIHVHARSSVRIDRVMKRDGIDRETVQRRIDNQWPEERRLMLADFTIYNNGTCLLIPQVFHLHQRFLTS